MLEVSGPFDPANAIIHGSTAFDPVSGIRTSVSESFYGGSGGLVGFNISAIFDPGLTPDNIFTVDPGTGRRTYRSSFGDTHQLCKFSPTFKRNDGTLELFLAKRFLRGRVSFSALFEVELSQPAVILTYILQTAELLFPTLRDVSGCDRAVIHVSPEIAQLIDWPPKAA